MAPFQGCEQPNDVWCTDFKGWFRTGRRKCHPFTLSDAYSRYLLRCVGLLRPRGDEVRRIFEKAFSEFGLPTAIRSDNGPPFSSPSLGGLSELSVWWMRLDIVPERIEPAHPEQNGRHERMHRTLEEHTANPPQPNQRAQQRAFDEFRRFFNDDRPHEALGMTTPSTWYQPSLRPMPSQLPRPDYPLGIFTFRVPHNGIIHWRGSPLYLSTCLRSEDVAIVEADEERWAVIFCNMLLAHIERDRHAPRPRYHLVRERKAARVSWLP